MAESRVVQGYIDPNFPNPMTESSATIIIYGCVFFKILRGARSCAKKCGQIHAFSRRWRARRRDLRRRARGASFPAPAPSYLVLQHGRRRHRDGDCWICVPHTVEPAESVFCSVVCGSGEFQPVLRWSAWNWC